MWALCGRGCEEELSVVSEWSRFESLLHGAGGEDSSDLDFLVNHIKLEVELLWFNLILYLYVKYIPSTVQ